MYERIQKPSPKKCAKAMKIMNLATGGVIIAFGVVGIIFMAIMQVLSGKFFLIFSPLFQILFGVILIAAQFKIELILQHFGFLKHFLGRGLFNVYMAASVYYYFSCGTNNTILAWVSSMTLFGVGIVYILLHFFAANYIYSRNLAEELQ